MLSKSPEILIKIDSKKLDKCLAIMAECNDEGHLHVNDEGISYVECDRANVLATTVKINKETCAEFEICGLPQDLCLKDIDDLRRVIHKATKKDPVIITIATASMDNRECLEICIRNTSIIWFLCDQSEIREKPIIPSMSAHTKSTVTVEAADLKTALKLSAEFQDYVLVKSSLAKKALVMYTENAQGVNTVETPFPFSDGDKIGENTESKFTLDYLEDISKHLEGPVNISSGDFCPMLMEFQPCEGVQASFMLAPKINWGRR